MLLTDSHAHLLEPSFKDDLEEVLERASNSNVEYIINCVDLTDKNEIEESLIITKKYENILLSAGVHPFDSKSWGKEIEEILLNFPLERLVAIGEIGIDPTYDVPVDIQKDVFRKQIEIAMEKKLPVIIHCRQSFKDILQILKEEKFFTGGILHTFSGTWNEAEKFLELGFHISFSGVLTYSKKAKEVATKTPFDKILVETDSPYLAPLPYKGMRNEPSFIIRTYEELSRLKGCSIESSAEIIRKNFISLFLNEIGQKWN